MEYKFWILTTFLAGTFGLPTNTTEGGGMRWRIHGGTLAGRVPYMVALINGLPLRVLVCGGSLVTTRTILTAAHCVKSFIFKGLLSRSLLATVGTNHWNVLGMNYRIGKGVTHPNYVKEINKNDIGLLITVENVILSNNVGVVPLYFGFIGPNVVTRVTGWGITEFGAISSALKQLVARTVDGERCIVEMAKMSRMLRKAHKFVDPQIELCTFHSVHHGTCTGDSGGPLVLAEQEWQIGVVSWGMPCALGTPDVFVRISAYKDWLQRNII